MSESFLNRHTTVTLWVFGLIFAGNRGVWTIRSRRDYFFIFRYLLARLFGSDGWNRTTDLGVMNPTL